MTKEKIRELIGQMTLEEKASLCSGEDFWHTKTIERLGIPNMMVSDGPNGLRKQNDKVDHLGINESIKAICFPSGCGVAASFNRDLVKEMGTVIGNECQAEKLGVILGPAVNIKRSPLCGRNFEYYSEDPYVAGEIASAYIQGVQSQNVGTSLKHFLANSQEHRRMSSSSEIDERTLREIYMPAFETAVKEAQPWTVMCSYNRINGTYAAENHWALTEILRDEWGFEGFVVSDWGAVNDLDKNVAAGMDLEMPGSGGINEKKIVTAVQNGMLPEEKVDFAVERILSVVFMANENHNSQVKYNLKQDHETARKLAHEMIVLLKNQNAILPLDKKKKIAFIGKYAAAPRFQGGGSAHVNSSEITSAWSCVQEWGNVTYAQGFDDKEDKVSEELVQEAVEAAKNAETAVIFAGLPDSFESEGYDRTHMKMPNCQNELIEQVAKVQPNTIVVLHNGSVVEMPWADKVDGILEAYLGGQAVGGAVVDILFGDVNPSAKLAESVPYQLEDNPSYLFYFGEGDRVEYREGVFVGYRYYDKKKMKVRFPFGYGLSYTTFEYSDLQVSCRNMKDIDTLIVSVDVTNTGSRTGKEVVELYVNDVESTVLRPIRELKGFEKVELAPGETKTVQFTLNKRAFAYWNTQIHDWHVESGDFLIEIGKSSRNIVLSEKVTVESTVELPMVYTLNTIMADVFRDSHARKVLAESKELQIDGVTNLTVDEDDKEAAVSRKMQEQMMAYMPIRGLVGFGAGSVTNEQVEDLLVRLNQR